MDDLRTSDIVSLHIAIGIPESTTVPTLSYSDFFDLSEAKNLSWRNIHARIVGKYEKRAETGDEVARGFLTRLSEGRGNVSGKLSVLIAPGFWKKFTLMYNGFSLAQSVLRGSNFKCYVLATGHHASNISNARELNPQITGSLLDKEVHHRYFCTSPVGLGEYVGKEMVFNLDHNVHNFFLLGIRPFVRNVARLPGMFHPLHMFTPQSYRSGAGEPFVEGAGDLFYASCAQNDRKIFDVVPFEEVGVHKN